MTIKLSDLPLSDLRRGLLETATHHPADITRHYGSHTLAWGERTGTLVKNGTGYAITDLGRIVLQLDGEHGFRAFARELGRSPIAGLGNIYGTALRCRCGWDTQTNEGPTKGGHKIVRDAHRKHVADELAKIRAGAA